MENKSTATIKWLTTLNKYNMFILNVGYFLLGLAAIICTVVPIIMYFNGEEDEAAKLFLGFWGAVAAVTATVLTMTFVVKPVLTFIGNLIF